MFFNLPASMKPMAISKGVDPEKFRIQAPGPMFGIEPFENYAAIPHSNKRVMGWNTNNDFSVTTMVNNSSNATMRQMGKDIAFGQIVEKNKRRF